MKERILLCLCHMSGREMDYIKKAFEDNWVVPLGPDVNAFEKDLEDFLGEGKKVVALSSGTAAVHLALVAAGVKAGDEVIVQSFTFCASSNPIVYLGATPVFVDSEPETWNMDPELLDKAIEDRINQTGRRPKAIMVVALYGMPYRIDEILKIEEKYNIPVIEDAAEGFGSRYEGRALGTFGKFGVLSFNGNKMITTSGGGALVCGSEKEKSKILFYATQAREGYPYYQHEEIGYNYRMSNISAAIGRGQMTILEDHILHHKKLHNLYCDLFKDVEGIEVHNNPCEKFDSNYWLTTILLSPSLHVEGEEEAYSKVVESAVGGAAATLRHSSATHTSCEPASSVEALRIILDKANVEARPLWKPMHLQPVYSRCPAYINGISENLFKYGLCLPSGPHVTESHVAYIVDTIKNSLKDSTQ